MNSCLYKGQISHRRHAPASNAFTYDVHMLYVDLDELDTVFERRWLWSTKRFALAWLRRADHLGEGNVPLRAAVDGLLAEHGLSASGRVCMLTHPRYFGYVSNPVTFYYCFDAEGQDVEHMIAEVTNTPWGERHYYVMTEGRRSPAGTTFEFDKAFHVSPFMTMDMQYTWRFSEPGAHLRVHNNSYRGGSRIFDATLNLEQVPISGRALAGALLRQPFMTFKVTTLIYFQAARLFAKRVPFIPHPAKRSAGGTSHE